ncbi:hypothetical protein SUGI_0644460 [Cryptomeria japonica]|nr:hypothetical protein SUGI_0644460 [Cryptomeria japonica]
MGNASFSSEHDYINLTPDPFATLNQPSSKETAPNVALQNCIGRVLYRQQLTMWPASFTTVFTIFVKNVTTNATGALANFNGDGLAFIIVPNNKSFLAKSYGAFLGLFDSSTNGNTTEQLAIEFDTYANEFDPDNNHVGIDIQSITYTATANMGNHGMDIKAGRAIQVRIHYDGWAKSLQIYARYANNSSAYASIVNHTVELENTVPRLAYVGFSAATGNSYEIHKILDWNFSSVMLPESSLKLPPMGTGKPGGSGGRVKIGFLAGSITVGLVVVGLLALEFVIRRMKKKKHASSTLERESFSRELAVIQTAPHRYSYKELAAATNNFSDAELLGTGGFGSVYRGNLNAGRNEQLRPSMRQAIQVLMNPNEELPQLPSTRPMAIYVVLPPVGPVFSQSTSSSNLGRGATSSSVMAESSVGSITTSLNQGR